VFVAFTGYGRIATMGEEVREPARTIPRAIFATLAVSALVYLAVAAAAVASVGAGEYAAASAAGAPLERIAHELAVPAVPELLALGALTAMLGVLLNLVLGLSRVALAMARRGDLPRGLSRTDAAAQPRRAVLATGGVVALIALPGDLASAWSFSAFAVLLYYAVTNLAALRLPDATRGLRAVATVGLVACLVLASQVDVRSLQLGIAVLASGLAGRALVRRWRP
jgi:APA family basic amino acid/polyamine antiporter